MPKERINLTLPDKILDEIKTSAEKNCRSISGEIEYRLTYWKPQTSSPTLDYPPDVHSITPTPTPENPTGQNHTPTASTTRQPDFQELAKQILGHRLDINEEYLEPDNRYYEYAKPTPNTIMRFPDTMPYDKQVEYLEEYKHYE